METYTVNVECHNCQCSGQVEVPKGTLAPSVSICPNCGCETAHQKLVKPLTISGWPSIPQRPIDWGNAWGIPTNRPYLSSDPNQHYRSDPPIVIREPTMKKTNGIGMLLLGMAVAALWLTVVYLTLVLPLLYSY